MKRTQYLMLALCASPVLLFAAVGNNDAPKDRGLVVNTLEGGEWGWVRKESSVSCENNPFTITFNATLTEAVIKHRFPINASNGSKTDRVVYKIIALQGNTITMQIVGETRLDPDGKPVVWDLWLVNERTYTWHRKDWAEHDHTPYIHKCNKT